jgi:hypothetical protein
MRARDDAQWPVVRSVVVEMETNRDFWSIPRSERIVEVSVFVQFYSMSWVPFLDIDVVRDTFPTKRP